MPTIAQQDYLRPQGKSLNDCHLLAALAHNVQQGTIFDTIISYINGDEETENAKVIAANYTNPHHAFVYIYDAFDDEMETIDLYHTQSQYEGLAAIQDSQNYYGEVPVMGSDNGILINSNDDRYIGVGGKKLAVTAADGVIATLAISDEADSEIDISWEDAQKLIGLPIS